MGGGVEMGSQEELKALTQRCARSSVDAESHTAALSRGFY